MIQTLTNKVSISSESGSTFLLGGLSVLFCFAAYTTSSHSLPGVWEYTMKYLGYTSFILIPMLITLLAIIIHASFFPLHNTSPRVKILARIETMGPVIGILGTFIGIGMGLADMTPEILKGDGVLTIASQIGAAVWNSVVGTALGLIAHLVRKDVVKRAPAKKQTVAPKVHSKSTAHPPTAKTVARRSENHIHTNKIEATA